MVNVDFGLPVAFGKLLATFPISSPTDPIVFGKNPRPIPFSIMPLSEDQRFAIDRAKKYALEQSIQNALNKQAAQLHQQDLNMMKRNHALILLSRIYVGSISFEIGEEDLKKTFSPFGPIKSVALSWDAVLQKHKGFAFVEFEVPEAASLALEQMNGYTLAGRNLKVGRPSNAPQTGTLETELRADEKTRSRVYVASIHPELTESDIKTVFEAFGKVDSCTLYPDPKFPGRNRGFGYIDFEAEEAAIAAVSSMNCFDLAGQQLRVGRAITPRGTTLPLDANPTTKSVTSATDSLSTSAVALAAASISAKVMSLSAQEAGAAVNSVEPIQPGQTTTGFSGPPAAVPNLPPPGVFIPTAVGEPKPLNAPDQEEPSDNLTSRDSHADIVSATTASMWDDEDDESAVPVHPTTVSEESPVPSPDSRDITETSNDSSYPSFLFATPFSRVLLLENMVGVDEVDQDLEEEVTEECGRYGIVLRVIIHVNEAREVRIFVQFDRSDSAQLACDALNQRFFAGRIVRARLYDEEQFQLRELDG